MKITIVLKGSLEALPPMLSLCKYLSDIGVSLSVICSQISEECRKDLLNRNIRLITDSHTVHFPTKIGTIYRWLSFHRFAWAAIRDNPADLYWIGSADTALALGKGILKLPYIIHSHELYDTVPLYRERLGIYMHHAVKVFVPEEVRAHIFRAWYHLKETPVVLPNKPYGHPGRRNLPITDRCAAEAFAKIPENSKILFYQGIIEKIRDLRPFAKAVCQMEGKIVLAIQGKIADKDYFDDLVNQFPIYYIPYVPAPNHLEITSHADFGLVSYDHINLNYEFCAPNKIWEYSGFGIPMLGNDVFGLQKLTEHYHAGVSVNFEQCCTEDIVRALQILLENQEEYSSHALKFFNSVNVKKIITDTIS